jgi:hypothetical protein
MISLFSFVKEIFTGQQYFSIFLSVTSLCNSLLMASEKPAPIRPAGTEKIAIPSKPIIQTMILPANVIGGVSANPPGSPIYCANAHTTERKPLL